MAPAHGLEPRLADSESAVLPLDEAGFRLDISEDELRRYRFWPGTLSVYNLYDVMFPWSEVMDQEMKETLGRIEALLAEILVILKTKS